VWLVDFSPARGSEQAGLRPALVLQNDVGNAHGVTTIVAAITTTIKPYPVAVVLDCAEGGLKLSSMVNLAQILTIDKTRLIRKLGRLSPRRLTQVDTAIVISLGVGS
jgi:mRNA interferase MazF